MHFPRTHTIAQEVSVYALILLPRTRFSLRLSAYSNAYRMPSPSSPGRFRCCAQRKSSNISTCILKMRLWLDVSMERLTSYQFADINSWGPLRRVEVPIPPPCPDWSFWKYLLVVLTFFFFFKMYSVSRLICTIEKRFAIIYRFCRSAQFLTPLVCACPMQLKFFFNSNLYFTPDLSR